MPEEQVGQAGRAGPQGVAVIRPYVLLLLSLAAVVVGLAWFYRFERAESRESAVAQVEAIARLKADELSRWRQRLVNDWAKFSEKTTIVERMAGMIAGPDPAGDAWIRTVIGPFMQADHISDVRLCDTAGALRWGLREGNHPVDVGTQALVRQALAGNTVLLGDIYVAGTPPRAYIDVVKPIHAAGTPAGAAVFSYDVEASLYARLREWPVPSQSAEYYLVRREGGEAVIISPLRHSPAAPLSLRFPLDTAGTTAGRAVLAAPQRMLTLEGPDYRGVPVFTVVLPIAGSPWYLLSEVDQEEIYREWRTESMLILLLLAAVTGLFALCGALLWQARQREVLERLQAAQAARELLGQYFRMLAETNALLLRARSPEELFAGIARIASAEGRFKFAWIGVPDARGRVVPVARAGEDGGYIDQIDASIDENDPRGRGPTGQVMRSGKAVVTNDFLAAVATSPWHELASRMGIGASLVLPVTLRGKVHGTLNLYAGKGHKFSPEAVATLERMVQDISFGLESLSVQSDRNALLDTLRTALQVVEAGPTVLFRWLPEANWPVAYVSGNVARWGYSADDFLSGKILFNEVIHPEDRGRVAAEVAAHSEAGRTEYVQTYRILSADGAVIWVEDQTSVARGESGRVLHFSGILTDITARVEAEQALQESEERLRLALSAAGQGLWDLDVTTGAVVVSPEYETMLGYAPGELEETKATFVTRTHPDDTLSTEQAFAEYLAGDRPDYRAEFRLRTKDGHWRWILSVGKVAERDAQGRPLRMLGTHTDITALKEAEQSLRLQSAAMESAADGIVITDVEGRIAWANPAYERLTGYSLAESLGKNPRDLVRSGMHDGAFYANMWAAILHGDVWRGELINRRKDGTQYTEDMTITPVRDAAGTITHFVAIKQDITERRATEERLRRSEERLYRAVTAGGIGLWDWDLVHNTCEYSDEWCRQLGCAREELTGTVNDWLSRVHPDDMAAIAPAMGDLDTLPRTTFSHECRVRHSDGKYRWILSNISLMRDAEGRSTRMSGANLDITARKELEEEFRQVQRLESIGRLAGGVAHDFNNLLSVISGYTEMAMGDIEPGTPLYRDLQQVRHASDRAASLTRQLLAFSRKQVLRPEVLSLNTVIADAEKMLRRLVGEDVKISTQLAEDLVKVHADPGQIEQVLMNLVVNARDAMPYGGELVIGTRNHAAGEAAPVTLGAGAYAAVWVADSGCGMDAGTLERIFEPFFTTKEQGKGTGLGLATVYGIVQQSGGQIAVESVPGRGSTFTVYLPKADDEPAVRTATAHDEAPRGTETIWMAEDEDALRELTERILRTLGYEVITFASGAEALAHATAAAAPPNLLLTDVVMPGMSGAQIAEGLRQRLPGLRVLYMSGYTDDAIVHHGVLDHGTRLINKPFSPAGLAKAVRDALDATAPA